jgi:hypothetical protein
MPAGKCGTGAQTEKSPSGCLCRVRGRHYGCYGCFAGMSASAAVIRSEAGVGCEAVTLAAEEQCMEDNSSCKGGLV